MKNENPQPSLDVRDEFARLLPVPPERDFPSGRQPQLQEFVVNHLQDQNTAARTKRRIPRRRFALATGALAAVAAAAVVLTVATGGGSAPTEPDADPTAQAVHVFEMAASHAAVQPWTEPQPDQWFYIKFRDTRSGAMAEWKGNDGVGFDENWYRADGKDTRRYDRTGELVGTLTDMNHTEYPWLVTLPTEPTALLAALRQQIIDHHNGINPGRPPFYILPESEEEWNGTLFARIGDILSGNLLPPALTAGLYRAAAQIPDVTVAGEPVMIDGRETTAVGRISNGTTLGQMLLDPETHEYVGFRNLAITDFTYGGPSESAEPDPTDDDGEVITEKAGELLWENIRLAALIVDEPGDTA
ncbi:CU044_5270 family protein [Phytomonospora sp. NPDC050363]|uniref:CU044_5270 family protein n=1 Tax=Phytomonospora sp. NPDC050363 TaxID=3155642 RepID=UPI0033C503D1